MAKSGIPYYIRDTNRYDDSRITKLITRLNASAVTVYDYLLEKAFKEEGCYLLINSDVVFVVAQALRLRESFVEEVIIQCCNVGLFDKDVHANGGVISDAMLVEKYIETCKRMKRTPKIPEILEKFREKSRKFSNLQQNSEKISENSQKNRENSEKNGENSGISDVIGENDKESSPLNPLKEKEKEENEHNNARIAFVGESEPETAEPVLFEAELPSTPSKEPKKETPAEKQARVVANRQKREQAFYDSLVPFVEVYGKEMIREFYDYWTEPNKSGTQMRFELERTWCLNRRLGTWARNNGKYERSSTSKPSQPSASPVSRPNDSYSGISELIGKTVI